MSMNTVDADNQRLSRGDFLAAVDHTLLKPETTAPQLVSFLENAKRLGVHRVCISPSLVSTAFQEIARFDTTEPRIDIVTVAGFPSGAHTPYVKAVEAEVAIEDGASEIDMVINRGNIGVWDKVTLETREVKRACGEVPLKVILETATLSEQEVLDSCQAVAAGGADFVKTSTGFDPAGGASVQAVSWMAQSVEGRLGVKASGGIRTPEDVFALYEAGATRFGVSATADILRAWPR
jgi:deoxyribose-phosphate aldolase